MNPFLDAIVHGLRHLAVFRGRDARPRFWFYVLFLYALQMMAGVVVMVPVMFAMFDRVQRYVASHPQQAQHPGQPFGPGGLPPELMPDMSAYAGLSAVTSVLAALLLAAAVTRRLHDRGLPGRWGLMPLPFGAFGLVLMPHVMKQVMQAAPDLHGFALLALNNLGYFGTLIALVVLLVRRDDDGDNRFGPPPVARRHG